MHGGQQKMLQALSRVCDVFAWLSVLGSVVLLAVSVQFSEGWKVAAAAAGLFVFGAIPLIAMAEVLRTLHHMAGLLQQTAASTGRVESWLLAAGLNGPVEEPSPADLPSPPEHTPQTAEDVPSVDEEARSHNDPAV
ncbi:MAG: hypothetical protein KDA79_00620 [Planctomycetaceae bacterium]|nr:hypothetical protein [Planctomycetaceae bacterium]